MSEFVIIIPARLQSSRLDQKLLQDIHGKTMLARVHDCAMQTHASRVIVAVDDPLLAEEVARFGGEQCMTKISHRSGTERLLEVVEQLDLDAETVIVNLQGDEPAMPPALIDALADSLHKNTQYQMATVREPIADVEELMNPHAVKVVCNAQDEAMYFSRAPIPYFRAGHDAPRDLPPGSYFRHVGLYGYRAGFLKRYCAWPTCHAGQLEQLEQLRVLVQGEKIQCLLSPHRVPPGVDTPEDLAAMRAYFNKVK